jgi:hypothetical protein
MITYVKITKGFKFKINNGNNLIKDKVFEVGNGYVAATGIICLGKQMNIEKIGTKKIDLYSFDMLGRIIKGEIRFEDMVEVAEQ